MSKTKAAQIAEALNKYHAERPFDFRQVAEAAAFRLGVGMVRFNGSTWIATGA